MDFMCLFRQYNLILKLKTAYHKINLLIMKCGNVNFDISLKKHFRYGNVTMCKKKKQLPEILLNLN
jgi:hypothetical protein